MKESTTPPSAVRMTLRWIAVAAAVTLAAGGGVMAAADPGAGPAPTPGTATAATSVTAPTDAATSHAIMEMSPATGDPHAGHEGMGNAAGTAPDHQGHMYSVAYLERNWKPGPYDSCPEKLHAGYNTTGPDGKIYPTWHPAQATDPATGQSCTFGHEHGDDPGTSNIHQWVVAHLSPEQGAPATNLPFGYASEELNDYAHDHAGMSMRHEDNGGHKVFVANDVPLLDADRNEVTVAGRQVSCDFLIKQHQGSWSSDATSNNAHEIIYGSKCTDGTELIATMLSRFGNSNEFHKNCAVNETVATVGSTLPAGDGGTRLIPTSDCLAAAAADGSLATWDLYELWKGFNELTTAEGTVLATFEPWFGIRNPSRHFDADKSTATSNGISRPLDYAWGGNAISTDLWRAPAAEEKFGYQDPRSPFNGATRDFYILKNEVAAAATSHTWYTDPYGDNARTSTFNGAIRQHVVAGAGTSGNSLAGWRSPIVEHGTGNGVHAPN